MAKWNPSKVIQQHAKRVQAAAVRAIRSASPRVPHRDGARGGGQVGGSLASAVAARDFLTVKPWGVVLNWSKLGQKFLWFVQGTSRQKARPVPLRPDVPKLVRDLEADAAKHYQARAEDRRVPVRARAR